MKRGLFLHILPFLLLMSLLSASVSFAVPDTDQDGVPDVDSNGNVIDKCPNSQTTIVDQFGCSCPQKNCASDNNVCTDDCSIISGLTACLFTNNNQPCPGGNCNGGKCVSTKKSELVTVQDGQVKDDFHLISENNIYAIGLDNQIWHWDGSSWSKTSTGGQITQRLFYVNQTLMYGIGLDNRIWRWNGNSWSAIAPGGQVKDDFHLISEDDFFAIGLDNQIWDLLGSSWVKTSTGGQITQRLFYVKQTLMYGIGLDNRIWKWNDTAGWSAIAPGGQVKDDFILVNNQENNIYAIGLDNQLWRYANGVWSVHAPGGKIQQKFQFNAPNLIYGIGLDNKIWKWNGNSWTVITPGTTTTTTPPTTALSINLTVNNLDGPVTVSPNTSVPVVWTYSPAFDNAPSFLCNASGAPQGSIFNSQNAPLRGGVQMEFPQAGTYTLRITCYSGNIGQITQGTAASASDLVVVNVGSGTTTTTGISLSITPTSFPSGTTLNGTVTGAPAGAQISISFGGDSGGGFNIPGVVTGVANSSGLFSFTYAVPSIYVPGSYRMRAHVVDQSGTVINPSTSSPFVSLTITTGTTITTSSYQVKDDFLLVSENDIYAIGLDNQLWRYANGVWSVHAPGGKIQHAFGILDWSDLVTGISGIGLDNRIWKWNDTAGWSAIAPGGQVKDDFHLVSENEIYAIGLDNQLWRYANGVWSVHAPGNKIQHEFIVAVETTCTGGGCLPSIMIFYGIGLDNRIWKWNGVSWSAITPLGKQVKDDFHFISENDIYAIGTDNQLWHYTNGAWSVYAPGGKIQHKFQFDAPNKIYGIGLDNRIWKWNGNSWSAVATATTTSAEGSGTATTTAPSTQATAAELGSQQVSSPSSLSFPATLDAFVTHLYHTILSRAPDSGGAAYWKQSLSNGLSIEDAYRYFFESKEYLNQNTTSYTHINRSYQSILFRVPASSEVTHWIASGQSKTQLVESFLASEEFLNNVRSKLAVLIAPNTTTLARTKGQVSSESKPSNYTYPPGCKNPSGGNYCGGKSEISDCYCDDLCESYGDCCSDFQDVCPLAQKENVLCVFEGSNTYEECYPSSTNQAIGCSGLGICTATAYGKKGEKVEWKSSCGGYATTVIDGIDEKALFNCTQKRTCTDSDGGENYYVKGWVTEVNQYTNWIPNTFTDICTIANNESSDVGDSIAEAVCEKRGDGYSYGAQVYSKCPNGCEYGACINVSIPQPPFNLTASTFVKDLKLFAKLAWFNVNGDKFFIYKNKDDGQFSFFASTPWKSYNDSSGLGSDIKYGYYVTAVNQYGESKPSNYAYVYG